VEAVAAAGGRRRGGGEGDSVRSSLDGVTAADAAAATSERRERASWPWQAQHQTSIRIKGSGRSLGGRRNTK